MSKSGNMMLVTEENFLNPNGMHLYFELNSKKSHYYSIVCHAHASIWFCS